MGNRPRLGKPIVTALVLGVWFSLPALPVAAQTALEPGTGADTEAPVADELTELLNRLADPETQDWQAVERRILAHWSRSGSAAMDLLYQRAQKALEAGDVAAALEHLTALTDHAPDFAEGWNLRASVLFEMGQYGPAMADLRRALALNPDQFQALTGLAVILHNSGLKARALEVYRMVEERNPHSPDLRRAIEALETEMDGIRI